MSAQPTTCHVCNAPVMVRFIDQESGLPPAKVVTYIRPVPPARDCEECGDVTCVNCSAADCPHRED